jgi:hypothetical protein
MWPFKKRRREVAFWISAPVPGVKRLPDGSIEVSYTEEEQRAVGTYLETMQRAADEEAKVHAGAGSRALFHPEAERILRAIGLARYAEKLGVRILSDSDQDSRQEYSNKVIAALTKAYSLSEFPIFIYDLGCAFLAAGETEMGRTLFSDFLRENRIFKPTSMYQIYLQERNLNEAIRKAKGA